MQKTNLVLGAVKGYSFQELKPFVVSLHNANFVGDICFLYYQLTDETIRELKAYGVILQPLSYRGNGAMNSWSRFWPKIKPLVKSSGNSALTRYIMKMIAPLQTNRFYNYRDFLRKNRNKYKNVLLTDVRDVIFQGDPFSTFTRTKIQCYEEDLILQDEREHNLRWLKALFGIKAAEPFLDQNILCSGTILGPIDKILDYLCAFEGLIKAANSIELGGSDQAVHNYLIRMLNTDLADVVKNGAGEVLTYSKDHASNYRVDSNGYFRNKRNQIIPIIHQYDRDEALKQRLLDRLN